MVPPPRLTENGELAILLESREHVRRLARALVGEAWAEDVAQDACVQALERPPLEAASLGGWLARVARHSALRRRAREHARAEVERRGARDEAVYDREERELEAQADVLRAVQALRQPYRTVVYLRYWEGHSPRRIARELDLPEATVKTRLRRGLALLRTDLERTGGRSSLFGLAFPGLYLPAVTSGGANAALTWNGVALMQKPLFAAGFAALATVLSLVWILTRPDASGAEKVLVPELEARADVAQIGDEQAQAPLANAEEARRTLEPAPVASNERVSSMGGGIFGRVVDESGAPIAGAEVRVVHEFDPFDLAFDPAGLRQAMNEATSDSDGRFFVPSVQEGTVQLVAEAAGFAPLRQGATAYLDLRTDVGELALSRGVQLSGRVVDSSGAPVGDVDLRAARQGGAIFDADTRRLTRTDAAGRFTIDRYEVGPWSLVAESGAHPLGRASGMTERGGERVDDIEIVLPRGAEIRGRVTGMPDGAANTTWVRAGRVESSAVGGFVLRTSGVYGDRTAKVDASGAFVLHGLDSGVSYRIAAFGTDQPLGGRTLTAVTESEAGASGVELPWLEQAALTFRAIDASTRRPIERLSASTSESPFDRLPVEVVDGLARLDELPLRDHQTSGTLELELTADGYKPWVREGVTVTRGMTLELGEVVFEPLPRVRVTVRDDRGRPVEGARVTLGADAPGGIALGGGVMRIGAAAPAGPMRFAEPRSALTDAEGRATLGAEPGATMRLSVRSQKHAAWEDAPFDMPLQGEVQRDVVLGRGAQVEVVVTNADGEPAAGVRVQQRWMPEGAGARNPFDFGSGTARFTDSGGRVWFRQLAPGKHGFRVQSDDSGPVIVGGETGVRSVAISAARIGVEGPPWTELVVTSGEEAVLALAMGARSILEGVVTERGRPLGDATVRLSTEVNAVRDFFGGGGTETRTDARGGYRLENIEPGDYELSIDHATRALPHREPVTVRAGGDRFEIDLEVAIARGVVRGKDGEPLAGARVRAERVVPPAPSGARAPAMQITARAVVGTGGGSGASMVMLGGGGGASSVVTDADGRFELRGLPPNMPLRIVANASDRAPARTEPFELSSNEDRDGFELDLLPGGAIAVTVHDANGEPLPNALVLVRLVEGGEPTAQMTDEEGVARFADLAPGRYAVNARSLGATVAPAQVEVDVPAGEAVPVRLDMP